MTAVAEAEVKANELADLSGGDTDELLSKTVGDEGLDGAEPTLIPAPDETVALEDIEPLDDIEPIGDDEIEELPAEAIVERATARLAHAWQLAKFYSVKHYILIAVM